MTDQLTDDDLSELPGADWCDECQEYECYYCRDFNSEHEHEVAEHATTCPDRTRSA